MCIIVCHYIVLLLCYIMLAYKAGSMLHLELLGTLLCAINIINRVVMTISVTVISDVIIIISSSTTTSSIIISSRSSSSCSTCSITIIITISTISNY